MGNRSSSSSNSTQEEEPGSGVYLTKDLQGALAQYFLTLHTSRFPPISMFETLSSMMLVFRSLDTICRVPWDFPSMVVAGKEMIFDCGNSVQAFVLTYCLHWGR